MLTSGGLEEYLGGRAPNQHHIAPVSAKCPIHICSPTGSRIDRCPRAVHDAGVLPMVGTALGNAQGLRSCDHGQAERPRSDRGQIQLRFEALEGRSQVVRLPAFRHAIPILAETATVDERVDEACPTETSSAWITQPSLAQTRTSSWPNREAWRCCARESCPSRSPARRCAPGAARRPSGPPRRSLRSRRPRRCSRTPCRLGHRRLRLRARCEP
mmetsp:Transcript_160445/g.514993  ORF Transcript_160445/g.514993 Transcript_160445/m.514993 type:complete len:214 (-) Transcript_160445:60-701(-)